MGPTGAVWCMALRAWTGTGATWMGEESLRGCNAAVTPHAP